MSENRDNQAYRARIAYAFARVVRQLRAETGLAQETISINAGLDPRYVGKMEQGTCCPTLPVLIRLAAALGREPEELVARTCVEYVRLAGMASPLVVMRGGSHE